MVVFKAMKIRRTRLVSFQRFGKSLKTRGYWGVCSVNLSSFKSFESFLICFFFCFLYFWGLTDEILFLNPLRNFYDENAPSNFKSGVLFFTKQMNAFCPNDSSWPKYLLLTYYPKLSAKENQSVISTVGALVVITD